MTNAYAGRIPDWNNAGLLPPFLGNPASRRGRSPYRASLSETMVRFGSAGGGRRELLAGLLDFRAALHGAGLTRGFQWIDGSFVEDVESLRGRAPGDIDVVTFFYIPEGHTEESLDDAFPDLFYPSAMKRDFGIDAYLMPIELNDLETFIRDVVYWHDMWSHTREGPMTREGTRKGYVQVDLDPSEDESARAELDRMNRENGGLS